MRCDAPGAARGPTNYTNAGKLQALRQSNKEQDRALADTATSTTTASSSSSSSSSGSGNVGNGEAITSGLMSLTEAEHLLAVQVRRALLTTAHATPPGPSHTSLSSVDCASVARASCCRPSRTCRWTTSRR